MLSSYFFCTFVTETIKKLKMNLLQKVLIPAAIFFVLLFVVLIVTFKHFLDLNNYNTISNEIELKQSDIANNIERISVKAVLHSASYSGLKTVKKGFRLYSKTQNIDSASSILGGKYLALSEDFNNITGKKFEIAFYSVNGVNLYRSWDIQKGDNSIVNQRIIDEAINKKETVSGLSMDVWGFAIYGITPVFDKNSDLLGVVETRFPINDLLTNTNLTKNENMLLLMAENFVEKAEKMDQLSIVNSIRFKKYVPIVSSQGFKKDNIDLLSDLQLSKVGNRLYVDKYAYYSLPLNSYSNSQMGIVLFQTDITGFIESKNETQKTVLFFGILIILMSAVIMIIFGRIVIRYPVAKVIKSLNLLAEGGTSNEIKVKSKDEIGKINISLNKLNAGFRRLSVFAKEIGDGKLDSEFETLSDHDEIGISLIDMRQKLIDAKNTESERKHEDEQRNWATKGFADFGDILRQNTDDIEAFSTNIIKNLVKYTNSNQGGLFILNDSDENNVVLELVSAYAYDRKKFVDKDIQIGEGLVGTCAIEKETIYITDVPDGYINITSGLGKSNPRNILIVPLKLEDVIFGVIELASFNIYEKFQVEFVEKLAESIASSLSTAKINIVTAQLLEQSQQQQEEMKAQEEELRQNMEEMLATQEESARKEAEAEGLYNVVKGNTLLAEFDYNGNVTDINENFANVFEVERSKIIGLNYMQLNITSEGITNEDLFIRLQKGETITVETVIIASSGKEAKLTQTFSSIKDADGNIFKIIDLAHK